MKNLISADLVLGATLKAVRGYADIITDRDPGDGEHVVPGELRRFLARLRLLHGVPGTEALALQDPGHRGVAERLGHGIAAVPVDDVHRRRRQQARGGDHVSEERLPGEGLQHLGQARLHALALAGGEDHHR